MFELLSYFRGVVLENWLGFPLASVESRVGSTILAIAIGLVLYEFVRRFLGPLLKHAVKLSTTELDDLFVDRKIFERAARAMPVLLVQAALPLIYPDDKETIESASRILDGLLIFIAVRVLSAVLFFLLSAYGLTERASARPINAHVEWLNRLLHVAGLVLIGSIVFDKEPTALLAPLSVLSFAWIYYGRTILENWQAYAEVIESGWIRLGGRLQVQSYGANGIVEEVTTSFVRVRNFDLSLTSIPLRKLRDNAFDTWGLDADLKGRRISFTIPIDERSVKACDPTMLEEFQRITLVKDLAEVEAGKVAEYQKRLEGGDVHELNYPFPSNLEFFRAWVENFIRQHPNIHPDLMVLVRERPLSAQGRPIEITCYSTLPRGEDYQRHVRVEGDLQEAIRRAVNAFDLRGFQSPSGYDVAPST